MPWLQRQQSADRWDLMLISLMKTPCSQSLLIRGHSGSGTVCLGAVHAVLGAAGMEVGFVQMAKNIRFTTSTQARHGRHFLQLHSRFRHLLKQLSAECEV